MRKSKKNILIISDTHLPFEIKGYLNFCSKVRNDYGCGTVVHIGDLVDNHSISYHEKDPDGYSPADEMKRVDSKLKDWYKEFPKVSLCSGNHDKLVGRKNKTAGLPSRCTRGFKELWKLPNKWDYQDEYIINGVLYTHSAGVGKYSFSVAAEKNLMSTVVGHNHSSAGIKIIQTPTRQIFGMNVGCGADIKAYAFDYAKKFPSKPVVSAGVVIEGRFPILIPMKLK